MRYFFDTSVLVPVFVDDHVHHVASLAAFLRANKRHSTCGAHSLAEVYSTLTRLPGRHGVGPAEAMLFLANIAERMTLVSLSSEEYWEAIAEASESGVVRETIYDALLGRCALKAKADVIYTWNLKHFERVGPEIAKRTRTP